MIKLAISSCLQVLITITIFNTRNCVRNSWEIHSSSCFVEYPSLYPMWCFACCCFCQHPSSAHQDPWFFQHLRYSNFSKFSTLPSYRIRGATRSEIARHLLVWAYHEWCAFVCETSVWGIVISGDFFTKHGGILYKLSCLRGMALRMSRFSFWCENYTCGDQIRRRTACIFWPELSYESSSYNVNSSRCNLMIVTTKESCCIWKWR